MRGRGCIGSGTFGRLASDVANALAMVLTEVLQNAVEHGYPDGRDAEIALSARRRWVGCTSPSTTTARGLPADFDVDVSTTLGLSIVRTLVESELGGQFVLGPAHAPGDVRATGSSRAAAVDVTRCSSSGTVSVRPRCAPGCGRCGA